MAIILDPKALAEAKPASFGEAVESLTLAALGTCAIIIGDYLMKKTGTLGPWLIGADGKIYTLEMEESNATGKDSEG